MPRKLVANLFYSVDGVAADPYLFQHDSFDAELGEAMTAGINNGTTKHVASRTLTADDLTWQNSQLVDGELEAYVAKLKETKGGDIAVQGSMSVVRQLVEAGLMDSLTLIMHPAIAGTGRRLFDGAAPTHLALRDVERTSKGNVLLTYGPFEG